MVYAKPTYTVSQKKVPTFKLSVSLSNLNRFSQFLHCWKAYESCYKSIRQYPSHLKHVATLAWEIKNANFLQIFSSYGRKCKQIAFAHRFIPRDAAMLARSLES